MESCDKNISKMRNVRGGEIDAPIRKSEFKQKIIWIKIMKKYVLNPTLFDE